MWFVSISSIDQRHWFFLIHWWTAVSSILMSAGDGREWKGPSTDRVNPFTLENINIHLKSQVMTLNIVLNSNVCTSCGTVDDTGLVWNKQWFPGLAQWRLVMHIWCISELGSHWFRQWFATCSTWSHYLNLCWIIVDWSIRINLP